MNEVFEKKIKGGYQKNSLAHGLCRRAYLHASSNTSVSLKLYLLEQWTDLDA
jgi:hypothetical protein